MIDILLENFNRIAGTVLSSAFVAYIGYRTYKKTRFNQASDIFRSKFLAILEGFYPVIHSRNESDYTKIRETIPKVESITADFIHFLKGSAKSKFNTAVQDYCQYCKAISPGYGDSTVFNHPSRERPPVDESKIFNTENFSKHVDNLLSFAKEK